MQQVQMNSCCCSYMLISHWFPLVGRLADYNVSLTTQQVYFLLDGTVYPICCVLSTSWTCTNRELCSAGLQGSTGILALAAADHPIVLLCLWGETAVSLLIKCTLKFQFTKRLKPHIRQQVSNLPLVEQDLEWEWANIKGWYLVSIKIIHLCTKITSSICRGPNSGAQACCSSAVMGYNVSDCIHQRASISIDLRGWGV